jgi:hypothetical protein
LHVALDRVDEIRNQVVAPLELNVDLPPGIIHLVAHSHERVVNADEIYGDYDEDD